MHPLRWSLYRQTVGGSTWQSSLKEHTRTVGQVILVIPGWGNGLGCVLTVSNVFMALTQACAPLIRRMSPAYRLHLDHIPRHSCSSRARKSEEGVIITIPQKTV